MQITIWTFSVAGLYRLAHSCHILYKAYSRGVREWFTIWMPICIGVYTITAFMFVIYLYELNRGHQWSEIGIKALFSAIFGIGCVHRWLQTYQYLKMSLSIPYVFTSITIDRYLKQGNNHLSSPAIRTGSEDGAFNFRNYM